MSALQAIPTEHGIDILNSELKSTVTRYQLIGALTLDANSADLYSFHNAQIETSYYDENGVLTFILNLPIEMHFDEYLYKINVLDSTDQVVIECATPKIALAKGIGGMVTLKAAISGQACDVIFKHGEYVTETELNELYLTPLLYDKFSKVQFMPYDPTRIYKCGEVCYTETSGKISYWEWYSNVESFSGKDPLDTANRRIGWTDTTKPFYWKPYISKIPGETIAWDNDSIPENMVVGMGQQLPVAVYHSLATAKPEWIDATDNTLINIPDRQGRFTRAANGINWISGETHEDAFQGHGHFETSVLLYIAGAGYGVPNGTGYPRQEIYNTEGTRDMGFGAPRIADETMPKAYIEWLGYAL